MRNRSATAERKVFKEVIGREKTREKIGKNRYEDVKRPQKLTLLTKPMAKLGTLCKKIEDLKSKNMKCIDTLTKYEEGHSSYSWKSGYPQRDDTALKIKSSNKSYQGVTYGQNPQPTQMYYRERTFERDAILSSGSHQAEEHRQKRVNICALNNNLKKLLQKRSSRVEPPSFSELKLKARGLSQEKKPLSIQASYQQRPGNFNFRPIETSKSDQLAFDAKAVDKSISQLDKDELVNLKAAIDKRMRSLHKRKDSDSDSTFEVQLAERGNDWIFTNPVIGQKQFACLADPYQNVVSLQKPKIIEKSVVVAGRGRSSGETSGVQFPESRTELDIEAYIEKYYKASK